MKKAMANHSQNYY